MDDVGQGGGREGVKKSVVAWTSLMDEPYHE